ncbi:MAG: alpha-ketoglutarate permease [Betaproteobacteria bacterium]|jgi:MHS family alpha-ketoglutarate permease-like MFS transporter|nr:alpha-ketoglutarate permease [Betaproteobacteria bacterium]MEA3154604.1 transporter, family, alpha-ketoglutarate permease [Betaproteobacteria bacterium]
MATLAHQSHPTHSGMSDTARRVRAIVAGSSGNLVEWFDFYVYSFTALYFAAEFFPKGDQTTQLLNAAGVFAAGFLMRPIGSWLFGYLADKRGRRFSMMSSVILMCGGSLMVAVLPTYASIGIAAPALLLLARLIQGLSVGGEYGTSATYMSEVAAHQHRGFFSSFQYVTLIGGQLLAVLVLVILQRFLSEAELRAWGWRIPFLIGALAAVVAFYLRRGLAETTSAAARQRKDAGTIRGVMRYPRSFLTVLGFTAGGSLVFYTFTTYMQKYLVNTAGMDAKTASSVMTAVLFCFMIMQPAFGAFADRIGRRNSMLCFGGFMTVATVPILSALAHVSSPLTAFGLIITALAGVSFYTSISGLVKAELFPMHVRALGVGLSYAIANAAFGGTAEYVALWFKSIGHESAFFWYVTAFSVVALVAAITMPETRRHGHLTEDEGRVLQP